MRYLFYNGNLRNFYFLTLFILSTAYCPAQEQKASLVQDTDTVSVVIRKHSPKTASIYSAVLPGMGQVYNRKIWKVPIVYAGFAAIGYLVYFNSTWLNKYIDAYFDFTDTIAATDSYLKLISPNLDPATFDPVLYPETYNPTLAESFKSLLINNKEYYRRNRDLSYIGLAAWYLLNIIDATVDAHFYDFDISDDLSMKVRPYSSGPVAAYSSFGIRVSFTF